ncbi:unnamed protein product [Rangifer tarandus platyrhynchus]|uniref:Uncharacterized protein n=3 Tax=Rangifer tarandus platyrhynchus TaxID=3082113 RepID=A0ACB0E6U1_RANTA|nr:unnamed protein product [Rangifer tarandus platyrhynchus]CAI9696207.1 unnamed protein product [Rangifer tarandus platyrhynchus]
MEVPAESQEVVISVVPLESHELSFAEPQHRSWHALGLQWPVAITAITLTAVANRKLPSGPSKSPSTHWWPTRVPPVEIRWNTSGLAPVALRSSLVEFMGANPEANHPGGSRHQARVQGAANSCSPLVDVVTTDEAARWSFGHPLDRSP